MSRATAVGAARLCAVACLLAGGVAHAQDRGEAHGDVRVFTQPAPSDFLVVITPTVTGKVAVKPWLRFDVSWDMDVVTGATPRTYGSPDVVSAATRFTEVRNVLGAGVTGAYGPATLSAGYAYGTENDYHSNLIRFGGTLDLFNHNTLISADYSHSFDSICDLAQPGVPVTLRQPLDSARGCFAGTPGLTTESLNSDFVEVAVSQTLTPRLVGSLSGTYSHLSGFQSNPYRTVRLNNGLEQAQESHPSLRDRGAMTAKVRYAVAKLAATLGGDLRLYRDTWGIQSITGEISWDQPFSLAKPAWRYVARARGYVQSGAVFYRDAGNSDSYEHAGPVGSFFTADQEMAPLADLLIGARFVHSMAHDPAHRKWHMFTNVEWEFGLDYIKIFALTPQPPNFARINNWASALVASFGATGRF